MTTLATPLPASPAPVTAPIETLADLMERLGGVPLDRVRFRPFPGTAVEKDVLEADREHLLCELVEGVLVEKALAFRNSILSVALISAFIPLVRSRNLGLITSGAGPFRLAPGLVRLPSAAYTSWNRLPGRRIPKEPIPDLAPDLAVELLTDRNPPGEMVRKRHDYFSAGVRVVWLANPETRTVDVYTSENQFTRMTEADMLDGGDVLPGFQLPVRDWFAELDRHG